MNTFNFLVVPSFKTKHDSLKAQRIDSKKWGQQYPTSVLQLRRRATNV